MTNLLQYSKMIERKKLVSHAGLKERVRILEEAVDRLKLEDAMLKQRLTKLEDGRV